MSDVEVELQLRVRRAKDRIKDATGKATQIRFHAFGESMYWVISSGYGSDTLTVEATYLDEGVHAYINRMSESATLKRPLGITFDGVVAHSDDDDLPF